MMQKKCTNQKESQGGYTIIMKCGFGVKEYYHGLEDHYIIVQ